MIEIILHVLKLVTLIFVPTVILRKSLKMVEQKTMRTFAKNKNEGIWLVLRTHLKRLNRKTISAEIQLF